MRVTETAHWLERADPILKEPFPMAAGQLEIPDRAGIGVEWDEDAARRFAVQLSTSSVATGRSSR